MLLRAVAIGRRRLETGSVSGRDLDDDPFAYAPNLERLTKPSLDESVADHGRGEMVESLEGVGSLRVADDKAAEAGEPGEGSLDHPAVPAEALAGVEAASGDAWEDAALVTGLAAARNIVGLVGVQLARSPAGPTPALADRRHRVEHRLQHPAGVDVGRGQGNGQGNAAGIDEKVALAARPAAIGRVRAGALAPLVAGTLAASSEHRRQSIALARPSRSSRTRCSRAQPPPAASRARGASRSCPSRSPSPGAASPKAGRTCGRTGCPCARPGREAAAARLSGAAAAVATRARARPTTRRDVVVWPCPTNPMRPIRVPGYVRHSYSTARPSTGQIGLVCQILTTRWGLVKSTYRILSWALDAAAPDEISHKYLGHKGNFELNYTIIIFIKLILYWIRPRSI